MIASRMTVRGGRLSMSDEVRLIREYVSRTDGTRLQNILIRVPDKVCAFALHTLDEQARLQLYGLIAPMKADRIKEEIRLEARRKTSPAVRVKILRGFLSYFGEAESLTKQIYIRPRASPRV
jgi:hypothetical protein